MPRGHSMGWGHWALILFMGKSEAYTPEKWGSPRGTILVRKIWRTDSRIFFHGLRVDLEILSVPHCVSPPVRGYNRSTKKTRPNRIGADLRGWRPGPGPKFFSKIFKKMSKIISKGVLSGLDVEKISAEFGQFTQKIGQNGPKMVQKWAKIA